MNTSGSQKNQWLFYVIMVLIPVSFFATLEAGLRIGGYGRDYRLFIRKESLVPGMLYLNQNRGYKYFENLEESVFYGDVGFYEAKPDNSFRVFVLGGSSAQGFPYSKNASFPSHLQRRLDLMYPDKTIEVINLGASAINSYTLNDILDEVLDHDPDLILIYAGHNEYYGALGVGSTQAVGSGPMVKRLILNLRELKIFQLLQNLIGKAVSASTDRKSLMQKMIGSSNIPFESDTYFSGIRQFEENMGAILDKITSSGVPVMIGTLTSNLRQKPFEVEGNDEARSAFLKATEFLQSRDSIGANQAFTEAKDLDGLRFRAPEAINQSIKELAARYRIPMVNVDSVFRSASPFGVTGYTLMSDHLHPNLAGYFLLSKAFSTGMQNHGLLPDDHDAEVSDSLLLTTFPFTRLDSIKSHNQLINLLGEYPFVRSGEPNPLLDQLLDDTYVEKLSFQKRIDSIRGVIAIHYLETGDTSRFVREFAVLVSKFPQEEHPYMNAIHLLSSKANISPVSPALLRLLKSPKPNPSVYKAIGMLYTQIGRDGSAIQEYDRAIALRPTDSELFYNRGYSKSNLNNRKGALEDYDQAAALDPENINIYHNRGVLKFEMKDFSGSIADFDRVIEVNTRSQLAYLIRGYAKENTGARTDACMDWTVAASLGSSEASQLVSTYCK